MRARLLPALLLAAAVALPAGCSGAQEAPAKSPTQRLEAARATLEKAGTVTLDLKSADVPGRQNGVTAATGGGVVSATEPKFRGTITGTVKGVGATVEVIAIGDETWLKLFTPDFEPFDLSTLNAPNPATFFDPGKGIAGLLPETASPTAGGQVRAGRDVLTQISGTLPAQRVEDLFHLGEGDGTYKVTYGLTDADQLRTATLVGPFFGGSDSTYTLTLTEYGAPVVVDRP
ncbi:LppX_LprAFG lipoprotein [Arthrobacter sp. NEB 688]|uniref:LppX_LprAFG lipoprotein n=1 Tax=Arthrobacter sp. NEB 688 TaxID=904039 RepID=UPI0015647870|nr:LppX_LprAFG lipoprotein [Arthrobacter sp. NEB 688]QKE83477.1 LppX_LprAFG lipoprotein [Arthrobacter sp. NEB 688]